VTNITAELIRKNLIYEKEAKEATTPGRRRVELAINPDATYVAGIKISSSRISCSVTDMLANVRSSVVIPVQFDKRPLDYIADIIEDAVDHCAAKAGLAIEKIFGIGVGVPGLLKSETGVFTWNPLYKTGEITLRNLIVERLGVNTYIENDSNALTLAHLWYGKGVDSDNFLVITIEEGVGMGIVIDRKLYRGLEGIASEFGHMVVAPGGELCRCGKRGCIEAYTNETAIISAAEQSLRSGNWCHDSGTELTLDLLVELAREGNKPLRSIFAKAGGIMGLGIAGLIQIFHPEKIIFSGDGVKAGDFFFTPMKRSIEEHTNSEMSKSVQVIVEKWKDSDWARGAATIALKEFYKYPFT
jgi:predicted NBD/HSP70 family sugar kinase